MHDGEVDIDDPLVGRLVAAQFPALRGLPISRVRSTGTVNAIFRLGDQLCARLPLVQIWACDLEKEQRWLPDLAPGLTLQIPQPVGRGLPGNGYPFSWAIYRWIDGLPYADDLVDDERTAAADLAQFVAELRRIEPNAAAPRAGRRPLRELDSITRNALGQSGFVIDVDAALQAWDLAVQAPVWDGAGVWIHTDLLRPNLIVRGGRLRAVIDFGGVGIGDPAADVIAGWSVFGRSGRDAFRAALEVDDETWHRAGGYALHQAALIIPYYRTTNPEFTALAVRTVNEVLADAATTS